MSQVKSVASKITSNLSMAMKQQSGEFGEVFNFLNSIKLEKYIDKFVDNGVEDQETILELEENHIEQMGIPLGHKLKIIKRIKEVRIEKGMSVPQSAQSKRSKADDIKYDEGSSSRPVTNNDYEELPDPSNSST